MADYEPYADAFVAARSAAIGVDTVRAWAAELPSEARVLDLGCGHGIPVARVLAELGCSVHGVDTSPTLLDAFRANVPGASSEQADAATFVAPSGPFDGVVVCGLLFLLDPPRQEAVIQRAAAALRPGGLLLVTAPWQVAEWADSVTGKPCVSLGRERYLALFREAGLTVTGEADDEGANHYWFAVRADPDRR